MDENLHNDPLENLFRKNLEDQNLENKAAAPNDWDKPSDQVWKGIGETLSPASTVPQKGIWLSSKMQIFAMAAGLLLLIGVFTCFHSYQQQLSSLSQQVEQLTEQQKTTQEQTLEQKESDPAILENTPATSPSEQSSVPSLPEEQQTTTTATATIPANPSKTLNETAAPQTPITTNKPLKNENIPPTTITDNSTTIPPATPPQKQAATPNTPSQDQALADFTPTKKPANSTPQTDEVGTRMATLAPLPSKEITSLQAPPTAIPYKRSFFPVLDPFRSTVGGKGFYAGLFYAPSVTFVKLKFATGGLRDKRDFGKIRSKTTALQGLKLGYQWNYHWGIEAEGRYGTASIKANHPVRLMYSRQKERPIDAGRFQGDYTYSIPTPYGDIDADISLYRESSTDLQDDDPIMLKIDSEQQIQFASIPVVVKYRTGKGPLRLSIRGGAAANFILKEDFKVVNTNVELSGLSHNQTRTGPRPKMTKKTSFDALAGIGLDFQPGPHWRFSLEPSFALSLKPVFKNSRLETYPRSFSVSAGINYQF